MSSQPTQLPNPYTPMAFFPPDLAYEVTIASYVAVGSLSVLIWDILTNLQSDWQMLRKSKISISIIAYFLSRSASLAYLLGVSTASTAPIRNCALIQRIQIIYPLTYPATSLLFFFRIQAMYTGHNWVIAFFFSLWLGGIGGSLTPLLGVSGSNIGTTDYCVNSRLEPFVFVSSVIFALNDTLIFCAMSWRLMSNSYENPTIKNKCCTIVLGKYLPAFSKGLLQGGQAYYLTTIGLNIVTASLFFNKSIPIVYRSFVGVPNLVLMNNMGCHMYRKIRCGAYNDFPANNLNTVSDHFQPEMLFKISSRQAESIVSMELHRMAVGQISRAGGETDSKSANPTVGGLEFFCSDAV
ncbi:hypothetical protein CPB84DRAFT_1795603 [Gymnopilus junonius]|uniref:DUF6533 domain-containing protein n=1 Tax=Gymnopilus junonius TaxID=109634 RepID=A0A9P5NCL9_GYMJU|nr:hypothetical protein CPB84DRAFT_1795603 [Gymnopilus junonius]